MGDIYSQAKSVARWVGEYEISLKTRRFTVFCWRHRGHPPSIPGYYSRDKNSNIRKADYMRTSVDSAVSSSNLKWHERTWVAREVRFLLGRTQLHGELARELEAFCALLWDPSGASYMNYRS